MHLWSPQLVIQDSACHITFLMSTPAEVYFLLESRDSSLQDGSGNQLHDTTGVSNEVISRDTNKVSNDIISRDITKVSNDIISRDITKVSNEIISLGYFGGIFAEEATIYVGDLSLAGDYSIWIVMKDGDWISDPYYFEFLIPRITSNKYVIVECFLPVSIDLLSTYSLVESEMELSFMIQSPQFPLTLYLFTESRDKHANRPSINTVIEKGRIFEVERNGTSTIRVCNDFFINRLVSI